MSNTMTIIHLFNVLQRNWETRADVLSVKIELVDYVRFDDETSVSIMIETNAESFYEDEWRQILEQHYPVSKIKSSNTSTEELRAFFDKEMLLFLEEYKPKFIFNETEIPIHTLLNEKIPLEFVKCSDS